MSWQIVAGVIHVYKCSVDNRNRLEDVLETLAIVFTVRLFRTSVSSKERSHLKSWLSLRVVLASSTISTYSGISILSTAKKVHSVSYLNVEFISSVVCLYAL